MKTKVSATVDEDRLAEAQKLTGCTNVSAVLDKALEALIVAHLERTHAEGYTRLPQGDETVALPDPAVWAGLPWDEDGE
jgi:Arc/MetJ family transcription regulator